MQATIDEKDAAFAELKEQKETLETQLASVDQFKKCGFLRVVNERVR